jgi:serine/threonine protein kinase
MWFLKDIKAGNILLSSRGKAMLSDFGVSTQLTDSNRRRTGTLISS